MKIERKKECGAGDAGGEIPNHEIPPRGKAEWSDNSKKIPNFKITKFQRAAAMPPSAGWKPGAPRGDRWRRWFSLAFGILGFGIWDLGFFKTKGGFTMRFHHET
jgi:hypothetical protein